MSHLPLRRLVSSMTLVVAVLIGVACSDDKKKTPTAPEIPNVPVETEVFTGKVEQRSFDCNGFSMANNGTITFELKDLTPLATVTMGLGVGQPDSDEATGCAFFAEDNSVKIFERFSSPNQLAGNYCICVLDVGNIFPGETVGYELEVVHPE